MKIIQFLLIFIIILLLTSCGAVVKARYYHPTNAVENTINEEWREGVATADKDVCVWVGDDTALYLPMMAGPIGLPVFPYGVFEGDIDHLDFFNLSIWIVANEKEQPDSMYFDPTNIFLKFENGIIKQAQTIQVSRFGTDWKEERDVWNRKQMVERISYYEHWGSKALSDFNESIVLWDWSRFVLRFEKPEKDIGPKEVEIKGLEIEGHQKKAYRFTFKEVETHLYTHSGKRVEGEWALENPATPCRRLFEKIK